MLFVVPKCVLVDGDCQVIKLDSSSPLGYERKYVALRGLGRHKDMSDAFEMMLLKLSQSPGPETRGEGIDLVQKFIY